MKEHSISRRTILLGSTVIASATLADRRAEATREHLPGGKLPGRTPNTTFAVNLEMWFQGPMEQRVEQAAELGFPAVEFWPYQNRNIPAIAKLLNKHNMTSVSECSPEHWTRPQPTLGRPRLRLGPAVPPMGPAFSK